LAEYRVAGSSSAEAKQLARENPIPAAVLGAFAGGVILGWVVARC
jgi:hypothetical protein